MYLDGHDDDPADGDADIMMAVATARYRKHSHHRYREHKHHNHHHHHHHHHRWHPCCRHHHHRLLWMADPWAAGQRGLHSGPTICFGLGDSSTNPLLELFIRSLLKLSLARGEASVVNHLQPERPQRTSPVIEPALALSLAANNSASGLRQYPLFFFFLRSNGWSFGSAGEIFCSGLKLCPVSKWRLEPRLVNHEPPLPLCTLTQSVLLRAQSRMPCFHPPALCRVALPSGPYEETTRLSPKFPRPNLKL